MLGAAFLVGACATPGGDHGSTQSGSLSYGGRTRTYLLYVPPHTKGPLPLVILLHGAGGDGRAMQRSIGFDAQAEKYGYLAVYPDGVDHYWNAGFCCPRPTPVASDDVGFISALIDLLDSRHSLDAARLYVAGFSNGGYMAYRLACQLSVRLAAIAAVGADSQECPRGQPARAVSVLQVHGTADARNRGHEQRLQDGTWVETPIDAATQWSDVDGCASPPAGSTKDKVTRNAWTVCRGGTEVISYTIAGGGHAWPRQSPDATSLTADFFRIHKQS